MKTRRRGVKHKHVLAVLNVITSVIHHATRHTGLLLSRCFTVHSTEKWGFCETNTTKNIPTPVERPQFVDILR